MENKIQELQNRLSTAHQCVQSLILQATAGNTSNVLSAINNIQYVYNELNIMKNDISRKEAKEKKTNG